MIETTDALYNSHDRVIEYKIVIYFTEDEPLVVTKRNYLISAATLEETQSDAESYLGTPTASELSFDLLNDTRLFTPVNTLSPYYGLITKGVRVEPYVRVLDSVDDTMWDPLGVFYVAEWTTTPGSIVASVTAYDDLYRIFNTPFSLLPIERTTTHKNFFETFFASLGRQARIDDDLNSILPWAYIGAEDYKSFLSDLSLGALADCYCDRDGAVKVASKNKWRSVRATFTDNDQIITASIPHTLDAGYDGADVVCNAKQESANTEVLNISNLVVPPGTQQHDTFSLSTNLMIRLRMISLPDAQVTGATASPDKLTVTTYSESNESKELPLVAYGTVLETVETRLTDPGENLLVLNSNYVQTNDHAQTVKRLVDRIVANKIPTLTVEARGNPRIKLGDMVHVVSNYNKVDYTGILIRAEYTYTGGLSCKYTFAAAQAFLEV